MKIKFKYPTIRLFFDVDGFPCIFYNDAVKQYPRLVNFTNMTWDIDPELVMSYPDFLRLIKKGKI